MIGYGCRCECKCECKNDVMFLLSEQLVLIFKSMKRSAEAETRQLKRVKSIPLDPLFQIRYKNIKIIFENPGSSFNCLGLKVRTEARSLEQYLHS